MWWWLEPREEGDVAGCGRGRWWLGARARSNSLVAGFSAGAAGTMGRVGCGVSDGGPRARLAADKGLRRRLTQEAPLASSATPTPGKESHGRKGGSRCEVEPEAEHCERAAAAEARTES